MVVAFGTRKIYKIVVRKHREKGAALRIEP